MRPGTYNTTRILYATRRNDEKQSFIIRYLQSNRTRPTKVDDYANNPRHNIHAARFHCYPSVTFFAGILAAETSKRPRADCFSHLHRRRAAGEHPSRRLVTPLVLSGYLRRRRPPPPRPPVRIGRSAARCIRLFPPINPSGTRRGPRDRR